MKKNRRAVIALALVLVFAVGCILYFTVISPVLSSGDETEDTTPETQEGESLGTSDRFQIFDRIQKDSVQSISVKNESGSFEFYRDKNDEFQIKGYEGISYNVSLFSELVTSAGYPLAKLKVDASAAEYEQYGLSDPAASWTITDTAGNSFTVNVGHRLLTDDGYYVCLEGREAVYELASSIKGSVLATVEDFVNPVVMVACTTNDYYSIDNFTIMHGNEKFISFSLVDEKNKQNPDSVAETVVSYPAPYTSNEDKVWTTFNLMSGFYGESVEVLGAGDAEYEKYGILDPAYTISFDYNKVKYAIVISAKTDDGYYYASSSMNPSVISKVPADTVEFLDYSLFQWISPYTFGHYITQISKLTLESDQRKVSFDLTHSVDENNKEVLEVSANDGTDFSSDDMVQNFRMFYRTLISVEMIDRADITDDEIDALIADKSNIMYSFTYETLAGKSTTVAFYPYSTRRCLVTIDGKGEFYVLIDRVEKLISDTEKLMTGETIDSYAKN